MYRGAPRFTSRFSSPIQTGCRSLALELCLVLLLQQICLANGPQPLSFAASGNSPVRQAQAVPALEPQNPIEREISANQTHAYRLAMTAGQYARVVARQQGIGVILKFSRENGGKIIEADSNGEAQGDESLAVIAEQTATYQLEVRASNRTAPTGRYEIRLVELRPATEHDKTQVGAETALLAGDQLRAQNRGEAVREAIKKYEEAAAIYRTLTDQKGEAIALARTANAHYLLSDLPKSLALFQQALPLFKATGEKKLQAYVLNECGLIYNSMGDPDKALASYNEALALKREIGDRWGEAATINNIGLYYSSKGFKQRALEYYNQSLQIRREVNDREGEAADLNNLGSVNNSINKKDKAIESYEAAVAIMRAIGDKRSEAVTLSNLGVIYASLGDAGKCLYYYNQALQIHQETGNPQGEAISLNNIGQFYSASGDKQKALEYYTRSLEIRRRIPDKRGIANMLSNIGAVHGSLGDRQKSIEYFEQALEMARSTGDFRLQSGVLSLLGRTYDGLGDKDRAAQYHNQSLLISRSVNDQAGEAASLATLAQLERDRNNLPVARQQIEAAIEIIDYLRSSIESQEIRVAYFATVKKYYDFYVDLLMRMHQQNAAGNYQAEAFQVSERARARMLIETLIEGGAKIREGVDAGLLERERELLKQLSTKADRLARLMTGKSEEAQINTARDEIEALRTQVQQLRTRIRLTSPRYASLTQPAPLSLAEIQKQALDADTLLLEYSLGEERSYLWAITSGAISSHSLPGRKEIETAAKRLSDLLTARSKEIEFETVEEKQARVGRADAEFPKAAAALSQLILSPVAKQLGNKKLLIVSDGILQYIPFAALPVADRQPAAGDYRPLIVDHEVTSIPSASTLVVMRRELSGRKPAPKNIAVLADPVFATSDPRCKAEVAKKAAAKSPDLMAQRRGLAELTNEDMLKAIRDVGLIDNSLQLPRLPGTRHEAEAIGALVARTNVKAVLDFEASREAAMSRELSQYRYVHIATHGVVSSRYPEWSGLVFSLVDRDGQPREGILRAQDIYNLSFPAELVVLSSCRTGLGQNIRGEGIVGLTRSFMYAGAARVMVSLWAVQDGSTARLMTQFYKDLLGAKPSHPAAALRAAQLSMLKDRQFSAPYYWAAFILQGEPN
jgi:CHAT domain-containing protein/tetratricopeptide (TPR) repeat protein